jgi:hypothetical protein
MVHKVLRLHGSGAPVVGALQLIPQMHHLGRDSGDPLFQHLELTKGLLCRENSVVGVRVHKQGSECTSRGQSAQAGVKVHE